ncbi:phage tail tape measure protein [Agromyces sp. NBRC 114283]|uniref:phage tail tape measure protein n=1 Tax=Agromyces sp. NBRC 114283 TaxID=2994521 RepID=UPI0024A0E0A7|nr:phage tail tape measure protein [Agromyces sp. NBRC 114283]GLU88958.1 phage tail tape measure protein [Agromyces sp. NBRC 114283]
MSDRVTKVRLSATVAEYVSGMEKAAKATRDVTSETQKLEAQKEVLDAVGKGALAVGAMAAAGVALAVAKFAEFDAQMSAVQAATHESASNMAALRDAALEAGADTVFSATEAAQAVEELGKAGVETKDVLGGGLKGALDLAAAGQINVADAAETAASAMTQFGLAGKDVPHIADLLAAGAGKAQGSVGDLSAALNQSGLVASQMGLSIEETVGTLAAFASAGLVGSDAGTSLRAMLLRLANPTDEAKAALDELGISLYNASGEFVGTQSLAGQLEQKLSGLTEAQKNQTLALVFGQDAIRGANILMRESSRGIEEWTDKVNDSGYAAETAELRMNNLSGDIEKLGGAFDTALIKSGSAANDSLRSLVQTATAAVDAFGEAPDGVQQATLLIGGLTAAVGLAGGTFLLAVPKVAAFKASLAAMGAAGQRASATMGTLSKTAGVLVALELATAVRGWSNSMTGATKSARALEEQLEKTKAISSEVKSALDSGEFRLEGLSAAKGNLQALTGDMSDFNNVLADFYNGPGGTVFEFATLWSADTSLGRAKSNITELDQALAGLVSSGNAEKAAAAWEELVSMTDGSESSLRKLKDMFPQYMDAQDGASESTEAATKATVDYADAVEQASAASQAWRDEVAAADGSFISLTGAYDSVIQKNQEYAQATADATDDAGDSWSDYYDGVSVVFSDYLAELEAQVQAQEDWESNMILLAGKVSQGTLDELAKMGPEAAPLVAQMVNASDDELAKMDELFAQRSQEATGAFATKLDESQTVIKAASGQLGAEAAAEIAQKLASGTSTVEQIVKEYGLKIEGMRPQVKIGTEEAQANLDAFFESNNGRTVFLNSRVATGPGGTGGQVFGSAVGNMFAYDNGGFATGFYSGGTPLYKFAEPETRWEAFISGKQGMEERNRGIALEAYRRLGGEMGSVTNNYRFDVRTIDQDPLTQARVLGREFSRAVAG